MILLKNVMKKILIIIISTSALTTTAQTKNKEDTPTCKELELACSEALKSADDLILEHIKSEKYLKSELDLALSQNQTLQKILLESTETPWYGNKTNIFLLGLLTGGILTWKITTDSAK